LFQLPLQNKKLARDTAGIAAMEYGIMASLISLVLIGIISSFGDKVAALFTNVSTAL
jgi:Flp pilus assembly pilin Flp